MSFNWNNATEVTIATGLGEIPVVGSILAGLCKIFWPESQEDVWLEIKDKVEALIGQAISAQVYKAVQTQLGTVQQNDGLIGDVNLFLGAISKTNNNGQDPKGTWISANGSFVTASPYFEEEGYAVLLLPLFAQMANLHLMLLRDGVTMGFCNDSEMAGSAGRIALYCNWADSTLQQGLTQRAKTTSESFNYQNEFARFMQLGLGNFRQLWPYFDPIAHPAPVTNLPVSKEIFYTVTEAIGPAFSSNNYTPPGAQSGDITGIGIYCLQDSYDNYNLVEGAQVTYSTGNAPYSGVLVGGAPPPNGGTNPDNTYLSYHVHQVPVSPDNPIVSVQGTYDADGGLYCIGFGFKDGSSTPQIPAQASQSYPQGFTITPPPGYYLSSIWSPTASSWYNAVRDMVFGFRLNPSSIT
jgi:hypothetical protein